MADDVVPKTFRALVESADRKFARVRDVPAYGRGPNHYFHKVFKAYTRLWKFQQENRSKLVESGLQRWEIGEIASRIGQLYFGQYMRTSEARFLLESYIFYEAIFNRGYFEGSKGSVKDRGVRFKELRFYARFLLVSLILNRLEMVKVLVERFKALVDDSCATFREINFKEWKLVVHEISRFMKADTAFMCTRPLRYCTIFESYPASLPYVARFHAKKVLKFRDALLTSYHRNEVKYAELTLDTFRMLQCLEWEPSGSFYQKQSVESRENGASANFSVTSGLIDINLVADMTDPTLPPNPRKAILYRPSVSQLIAVIATMCEELPSDSVMLIYLSASGKTSQSGVTLNQSSGSSRKSTNLNVVSHTSHIQNNCRPENHVNDKGDSTRHFENYVWLGPSRNGGSNNLYPGDIIPFTRRPLFLIIDSDNSHAFKVLHGAERGEPAALLLSPLRRTFKKSNDIDVTQNGSQFTLFLTAPLQAFCQMVGLICTESSDNDADIYSDAENVISTAFSEWEVILCTSTSLDLVWAQVLSDPFLRRLILRFVFCRAVLAFFGPREESDEHLPVCLPALPNSFSPNSKAVRSAIIRLADHLKVEQSYIAERCQGVATVKEDPKTNSVDDGGSGSSADVDVSSSPNVVMDIDGAESNPVDIEDGAVAVEDDVEVLLSKVFKANETNLADGGTGASLWEGHSVQGKYVQLLLSLKEAHPETFGHFQHRSAILYTSALNTLGEVCISFARETVANMDADCVARYKDMLDTLKYLKLDVGWLYERLNLIEELHGQSPLIKEYEDLSGQVAIIEEDISAMEREIAARQIELEEVKALRATKVSELEDRFGSLRESSSCAADGLFSGWPNQK